MPRKIIFVPERTYYEAATRYRVYLLARHLKKYMEVEILHSSLGSSHEYSNFSFYKRAYVNIKNNLLLFNKMMLNSGDIFIFQRGEWQKGKYQQMNFFRRVLKLKMVYDIDDAVFLRNKRVFKIFEFCNAIFAGSHFILEMHI